MKVTQYMKSKMLKILMLIYAFGAYTMSMMSLIYLMGFLAGFGVPKKYQ